MPGSANVYLDGRGPERTSGALDWALASSRFAMMSRFFFVNIFSIFCKSCRSIIWISSSATSLWDHEDRRGQYRGWGLETPQCGVTLSRVHEGSTHETQRTAWKIWGTLLGRKLHQNQTTWPSLSLPKLQRDWFPWKRTGGLVKVSKGCSAEWACGKQK